MKSPLLVVLLFLTSFATAQVTVTSIVPADHTTNVPLQAAMTITFSAPMDTTRNERLPDLFITNVDTMKGMAWSADRTMLTLYAGLKPSTVYFFVIHGAWAADGSRLSLPAKRHFTTAASFPAGLHTVSGQVTSGSTPHTPGHALVAFSLTPFSGEEPQIVAGTLADANGAFTVPYVPSGSYYPIAAKDAVGEVGINPSEGDPIATLDSAILVGSSDVTGVILPFVTTPAPRWAASRDQAIALAGPTFPGYTLRSVFAYDVDSTGGASSFAFLYSNGIVRKGIEVSAFGARIDTAANTWNWMQLRRPIPDITQAALLDSVIAKVERSTGRTFRHNLPPGDTLEFRCEVEVGALHMSGFGHLVTDTTKLYWGVRYSYMRQVAEDSAYFRATFLYLCDYETGAILRTTDVAPEAPPSVPDAFALAQNYPNPFNPSTTITYGLPVRSAVRLTVYNVLGQIVATLVQEEMPAGQHQAVWSSSLPSGLYFYRLEAAPVQSGRMYMETRKMMLVR